MASSVSFSARIVSVDSCMVKPARTLDAMTSETLKETSQKAPVIRIFGSTPAGQTVCVHVHRVFPYLYVPYDGSGPTDVYLRQFASSLDHALNFDGKNPSTAAASAAGGATIWSAGPLQHVFKISIVKGIPFYGFYEHEVLYLKIYFYNPASVKRATKLLIDGVVLRKSFQPYEAHIPYILQFFMDYNLQGMNFINVKAFQFRSRGQSEVRSERAKLRDILDLPNSLPLSLSGIGTTYHAPNTSIFPAAAALHM